MTTYREKIERLGKELAGLPGAVLCFSGGVDSTMLLQACIESLGRNRVMAVTANSPSFPLHEQDQAVNLAQRLGVEHHLVATSELEDRQFRINNRERCYFCKRHIFSTIITLAREADRADWPLLHGATFDDRLDCRPGHRAALELGARAPLAEVELTKEEVRRYSRERSLPTADKPSFSCLATRIAYGTEVTASLLQRIGRAEDYLRKAGFTQYRVRHHGLTARIELWPEELLRAVDEVREDIVKHLKQLGWTFVTLDLEGFRSGSMNY